MNPSRIYSLFAVKLVENWYIHCTKTNMRDYNGHVHLLCQILSFAFSVVMSKKHTCKVFRNNILFIWFYMHHSKHTYILILHIKYIAMLYISSEGIITLF